MTADPAAFLKQFDDPAHKDLFAYWHAKRAGRLAPARGDIDPVEIPHLLPDLALVDVVDGGARFLFRLIGTRIVERGDDDFTGSAIDEVALGAWRDHLRELFADLVQRRTAVFSNATLVLSKGQRLGVRQLLLPLQVDGEPVGKILFSPRFARLPGEVRQRSLRWTDVTQVIEERRHHFG